MLDLQLTCLSTSCFSSGNLRHLIFFILFYSFNFNLVPKDVATQGKLVVLKYIVTHGSNVCSSESKCYVIPVES